MEKACDVRFNPACKHAGQAHDLTYAEDCIYREKEDRFGLDKACDVRLNCAT